MITRDLVQGEFSAVRMAAGSVWSFFAISAAVLSVLSGKKTLTAENAENCRRERRVCHLVDYRSSARVAGFSCYAALKICIPGKACAK